jgi:integrase
MSTSQSFLTPDEVIAVLKAAKEQSPRDWAMVLVSYRHGLRSSEVCDLRRDDVDLKYQAITVRRLKGSLDTVQPLYPHRGVPLLDELAATRTHLRDRQADGSDFLFVFQKGGRLHRSQFVRVFQSIADSVGLPTDKRHPHLLKYSLASHLVAGNCNLALIKQQLGRASISSTMLYIGTSDQQASEAASAVLSTDSRAWVTETRALQENLGGSRLRQAGRCATHKSRRRNSEAQT